MVMVHGYMSSSAYGFLGKSFVLTSGILCSLQDGFYKWHYLRKWNLFQVLSLQVLFTSGFLDQSWRSTTNDNLASGSQVDHISSGFSTLCFILLILMSRRVHDKEEEEHVFSISCHLSFVLLTILFGA